MSPRIIHPSLYELKFDSVLERFCEVYSRFFRFYIEPFRDCNNLFYGSGFFTAAELSATLTARLPVIVIDYPAIASAAKQSTRLTFAILKLLNSHTPYAPYAI